MNPIFAGILLVASLALVGCAGPAPTAQPVAAGAGASDSAVHYRPDGQIDIALASGTYACELGQSLQLERTYQAKVNLKIDLGWNGKRYQLERDNSSSGLPRFREPHGRLVWVDLPWKGMLLDGRTNKPLANECKLAQG